MSATAISSSSRLIEAVNDIIRKKLSKAQAELVVDFSINFYSSVAEEDILKRSQDELYASIISLWNFCQTPVTQERGLIRVSNPNIEEHGWQSKHTVIELLYVDMPFLVDSIRMELNRLDLDSHLMIHVPFDFKRNKSGKITGLSVIREEREVATETPMYIEVDRETSPLKLLELKDNLKRILNDVSTTVRHWQPMKQKMSDVIAEVQKSPYPKDKNALKESTEFLRWIDENHFTYMGYRYYDFISQNGDTLMTPQPENSLGVTRFF